MSKSNTTCIAIVRVYMCDSPRRVINEVFRFLVLPPSNTLYKREGRKDLISKHCIPYFLSTIYFVFTEKHVNNKPSLKPLAIQRMPLPMTGSGLSRCECPHPHHVDLGRI